MREVVQMMFSEEEVDDRIREMGESISKDLNGAPLTIFCVLKGASFFACELAKRISVPVYMEFIRASSYGDEMESSGTVTISEDSDWNIAGANVLIVEDIIDTGNTLSALRDELLKRNPNSLKISTLLDKPSRRIAAVPVDYVGFSIPDAFVVGYGLDYAQKYRNLPYIGVLSFQEE